MIILFFDLFITRWRDTQSVVLNNQISANSVLLISSCHSSQNLHLEYDALTSISKIRKSEIEKESCLCPKVSYKQVFLHLLSPQNPRENIIYICTCTDEQNNDVTYMYDIILRLFCCTKIEPTGTTLISLQRCSRTCTNVLFLTCLF